MPNVKYVANMHGNESTGRELMLHLILHLVQNYDTDEYIKWLLENTKIHVHYIKIVLILKKKEASFQPYEMNGDLNSFFFLRHKKMVGPSYWY